MERHTQGDTDVQTNWVETDRTTDADRGTGRELPRVTWPKKKEKYTEGDGRRQREGDAERTGVWRDRCTRDRERTMGGTAGGDTIRVTLQSAT